MKIKEYLFKKNSVFYTWLLSYMTILLIPVFFSGIVYIVTSRTIEDEINRSNHIMLKQVQLVLDKVMQDVEKLSLDIAFNPRLQQISLFSEPIQPSDQYTITQLLADLKMYTINNSYIDDFYVYFKGLDSVLSPFTYGKSNIMYDALSQGGELTYEQWHDMLTQPHYGDYLPLTVQAIQPNTYKRTIVYLRSVPIIASRPPNATVAVTLNEGHVHDMIKNIEGEYKGEVLIIGKDNKILAATTHFELPDFLKYENLEKESGLLHKQLNGENVAVIYNASTVSGLKYVSIIPDKIFMEKSGKIRSFMGISIVLCILIGGIVSVAITIRNYNPVNELLKLFAGSRQSASDKKYNEYQLIREVFHNTLDEKEMTRKKLEQQNPVIRSDFFAKLLKGKFDSKLPVNDVLQSLHITFDSDYFAVLLFDIEDLGDYFSVTEKEEVSENSRTAQFIVANVVEELAGHNHKGYTVEIDEKMVCILNLNSEGISGGIQDLIEIASETRRFIQDNLHIDLTVSVSAIHQTLNGIAEAFEEAFKAMEYKMVVGIGKVIHYDDIKMPRQNYYYPFGTQHRLINCIKAGNFESASEILDEIFKENFAAGALSLELAKCLMFDLASTVAITINEIEVTHKSSISGQVNPIGKLLECVTIMDMKNLILDILQQVCQHVRDEKKNNTNKLSTSVIEYVSGCYMDANLNISMIAEEFDMTPTYISRLFKEQTGEVLLDYINKVRLEKAKELLKSGELNIGEIAAQVGYGNSNTLIRIFKKFEGITPGQYKNFI